MESQAGIEETKLTETVKKSRLRASSLYDFQKLAVAGEHFLTVSWVETDETVLFSYDINHLKPFTEVRQEEQEVILNLLMQAAKFQKDAQNYGFLLEPGNLYYNNNGSIYIKERDLIGEETIPFLAQYKALAGCALTGAYTYKDYIEGGEELYKKNTITEPLLELNAVEEIISYLEKYKQTYLQKQKREKVVVKKRANLILKICVVVFLILTLLLGTYSGIQCFKVMPYMKAVNTADNAYIENDNVLIIGALKEISTEDMDIHQKYILAKAYLQSENLTEAQKANILQKLTIKSDEKELDYWIYLGRLNVEQAENLSMQLSDDELLLYAYMKDKSLIESDTGMTGTEKEQAIKDIQTKIDEIAKKYEIETDSDTDTKSDNATGNGTSTAINAAEDKNATADETSGE